MANELQILIHASTGMLATVTSVWLTVELLHAKNNTNVQRIKYGAILVNIFVWLSYIIGGWYYVFDYSNVDKYIINGSTDLGFSGSAWTFAHGFFTESKEHFFFIGILIALYLLMLAYRSNFASDEKARRLMLVLTVTLLIGGMVLEGFGAIMSMGVRLGMIPG
jgi:hypothetical protein